MVAEPSNFEGPGSCSLPRGALEGGSLSRPTPSKCLLRGPRNPKSDTAEGSPPPLRSFLDSGRIFIDGGPTEGLLRLSIDLAEAPQLLLAVTFPALRVSIRKNKAHMAK